MRPKFSLLPTGKTCVIARDPNQDVAIGIVGPSNPQKMARIEVITIDDDPDDVPEASEDAKTDSPPCDIIAESKSTQPKQTKPPTDSSALEEVELEVKNDECDTIGDNGVASTHPYPNVTLDKKIDFNSINEILQKVFKHSAFRSELQRSAIEAACKFDRDLFVSLPTGSGKSLIYQLPALYKNSGLSIVVSPLVALISNQLLNARRLGIPCATINSHMPKTWNGSVKKELLKKESTLRLLYITPETLCSDHFQYYLSIMNRNKTLKLFAIDEAHCVSSWGHEFRPDYLKLGQLRACYPRVPIMALTATATKKVLQDILDVLNLRDPEHVIASSFRKNLFYDVIDADQLKQGPLVDLSKFMRDCLGLKKPPKAEPRIKAASKFCSGSAPPATGRGQFVSAAMLLDKSASQSTSKSALPTISRTKPRTSTKLLARETKKITSFFRTKKPNLFFKTKIQGADSESDEGPEINSDTDEEIKKHEEQARSSFEETFGMPAVISEPVKKKSRLEVRTTASDNGESVRLDRLNRSGVGIVYCRTKINCEDVSVYLNKQGIPSRPYHSSLSAKERKQIEELWMDEEILVICATISFGMGIDKPNVRAVVHFNLSQSLANYYQESGRAGRDGKQSNCRLYYSQSDVSAISFLLRKDIEEKISDSNEHKLGSDLTIKKQATARAAMERFNRMVEYCKSRNKCRHQTLAKEFSLGDADSFGVLAKGCGGSCDCCILKYKS